MYEAWFDGSYFDSENTGIGFSIIKNGKIIHSSDIKSERLFRTNQLVEAYALENLVNKVVDLGINSIKIYGDEKNVVEKVNKKFYKYIVRKDGVPNYEYNSVYYRIVQQLSKLDFWELLWVSRYENIHAHALSRVYLNNNNSLKQLR